MGRVLTACIHKPKPAHEAQQPHHAQHSAVTAPAPSPARLAGAGSRAVQVGCLRVGGAAQQRAWMQVAMRGMGQLYVLPPLLGTGRQGRRHVQGATPECRHNAGTGAGSCHTQRSSRLHFHTTKSSSCSTAAMRTWCAGHLSAPVKSGSTRPPSARSARCAAATLSYLMTAQLFLRGMSTVVRAGEKEDRQRACKKRLEFVVQRSMAAACTTRRRCKSPPCPAALLPCCRPLVPHQNKQLSKPTSHVTLS